MGRREKCEYGLRLRQYHGVTVKLKGDNSTVTKEKASVPGTETIFPFGRTA